MAPENLIPASGHSEHVRLLEEWVDADGERFKKANPEGHRNYLALRERLKNSQPKWRLEYVDSDGKPWTKERLAEWEKQTYGNGKPRQ
jgi:hypothetical protein